VSASSRFAAARNRGWTARKERRSFSLTRIAWLPSLLGCAEGLSHSRTASPACGGATVYDCPRPTLRDRFVEHTGVRADYHTCNIAYRRATSRPVGGFDERLASGREDTDLALRVLRAGRSATAGHAGLPPEAAMDRGQILGTPRETATRSSS